MTKHLTQPVYALSIIIMLTFVTRIPQLINPDLLLDGDECVVGLMAKHMYEGKEVPVYFYGQSYGFSLLETTFIVAGYAVGGISDHSIKLSMLCLWLTGAIFFYFTLRSINKDPVIPFAITLLLVLCPAWAEWSMKARGGYITAFVLSSVITWLLFDKRRDTFSGNYVIIGLLLFLIYKSQPLWLPGLFPLVAYRIMGNRGSRKALYIAGGIIFSIALFCFLDKNAPGFWNPHVFDFSFNKDKLAGIPLFILLHLTGAYYLPDAWLPAIIFACLFIAVNLFLFCLLIYRFVKNRQQDKLFIALCLSVLFTLAYCFVLYEQQPRYLLPLSGYALMAMCTFKWQRYRLLSLGILTTLIITGGLTLYRYKNFRINMTPKKDLLMSVNYLKRHNIQYVFCTGSLLQWQLMFYSNESIIARYVYPSDRYPAYVRKVNEALVTERNKTAIYGFSVETLELNTDSVTFLSDKYFVVPAPDPALVRYTGFKF